MSVFFEKKIVFVQNIFGGDPFAEECKTCTVKFIIISSNTKKV